jgi:uncharacterized protein (DUF1800 family)
MSQSSAAPKAPTITIPLFGDSQPFTEPVETKIWTMFLTTGFERRLLMFDKEHFVTSCEMKTGPRRASGA